MVVIDKILGEALLHKHTKFVDEEPSSVSDGQFIYIIPTHEIKFGYDGSWYLLHTLEVPDKLLLETGDYLLLEDGGRFLLE